MPRYRYTDVHERVLHGLGHGVNAAVERDGEPVEEQGTVVARPGDLITTRDPFEHAFLALLDEDEEAGDPPADTPKPPRAPRGRQANRTQE